MVSGYIYGSLWLRQGVVLGARRQSGWEVFATVHARAHDRGGELEQRERRIGYSPGRLVLICIGARLACMRSCGFASLTEYFCFAELTTHLVSLYNYNFKPGLSSLVPK